MRLECGHLVAKNADIWVYATDPDVRTCSTRCLVRFTKKVNWSQTKWLREVQAR